MQFEQNDFVNPNQRGVELPAGLKDLHEMLEKLGAQKPVARPSFPLERGSLKDLPRFVQGLYMEQYGLSLAITIRAAKAILWIHNRYGGPRLSFLVRDRHIMLAPVIQDLFGNVAFEEENKEGIKQVTVPLPYLWLEAAEIVEILIRGYGATENSELLFHFVRQEE